MSQDQDKITKDVDALLGTYLSQQHAAAKAIDDGYGQQWQMIIDFVVTSGGKRLRPKMLMMTYEAFGGEDYVAALHLAAAQEILHASLLIHDDIIDRQLVRRGRLNIAGKYEKIYDDQHLAMGAALLAGDLCISSAYQLLAAAKLPGEVALEVSQLFGRSIHEVAGGQLIDMESAVRTFMTQDALQVAQYKTASYSFEGPLVIGATAAGASDAQTEMLRKFARHAGIAFQIVDDLLGMFGEDDEIGKSSLADLQEGKQTVLITLARELASDEDRLYIEKVLGDVQADRDNLLSVRQVLQQCGAQAQAEAIVDEHVARAQLLLDGMSIPASSKADLSKLLTMATQRRS